jgi:hypothetical protein
MKVTKMAKSEITTLDDKPEQAAAVPAAVVAHPGTGLSGKMEVLTINSSPEDGGSEPVFLNVNDYAFHVPRDMPCTVPTEYVEALRNAKVTTYKNGSGNEMIAKTMPRYSFTAVPV